MLSTAPENLFYYTRQQLWELGIHNVSITPGFGDLTESFEKDWSLEFDTEGNPLVVVERLNDHKTGTLRFSLRRQASDISVEIQVSWSQSLSAEELKTAWEILSRKKAWGILTPNAIGRPSEVPQLGVEFCEADPDYGTVCGKPGVKVLIPKNSWKKVNKRGWRTSGVLTYRNYQLLTSSPPNLVTIGCNFPMSAIQLNFCDSIPLTSAFTNRLKLIKPEVKPSFLDK